MVVTNNFAVNMIADKSLEGVKFSEEEEEWEEEEFEEEEWEDDFEEEEWEEEEEEF